LDRKVEMSAVKKGETPAASMLLQGRRIQGAEEEQFLRLRLPWFSPELNPCARLQ
jgi:hypothetical protein